MRFGVLGPLAVWDADGRAVRPEDVDAGLFASLLQRARETADLQERAALLREALELWRGPAFAEFAGALRAPARRAHPRPVRAGRPGEALAGGFPHDAGSLAAVLSQDTVPGTGIASPSAAEERGAAALDDAFTAAVKSASPRSARHAPFV